MAKSTLLEQRNQELRKDFEEKVRAMERKHQKEMQKMQKELLKVQNTHKDNTIQVHSASNQDSQVMK